MTSASDVYQLFIKHCDEHQIPYEKHDDNLTLKINVRGEDLPQPTVVYVIERANVVMIRSPFPFSIPEDKRPEAAIGITIANYGMINGCFEMDMRDGEIGYKIAQGFHDIDFSDEMISYMFTLAFTTTDKFNDKFFGLAMGMFSLEQFIAAVQNN